MNLTKEYRFVLLYSLFELGGRSSKNGVLEHIRTNNYWKFEEDELKPMRTRNEIKWHNSFAFIRRNLVDDGYLYKRNDNVWQINETGLDYMKKIALEIEKGNFTSLKKISKILFEKVKTRVLLEKKVEVYDSWKIIKDIIAVKTTDKSVFKYKGSAIPKGSRWFWNVEMLEAGGKKKCILIYENKEYKAYIEKGIESHDRTRLFWYEDLGIKLNNVYKRNISVNYPLLKFKKVGDDVYEVSFIFEDIIENDIDIESDNNCSVVDISYGQKEGSQKQYFVTRYERNPINRRKCIELKGTKCSVCGFDFGIIYGERGRDYIEVHHIKPLHSIDEEVTINPYTDLEPICSNCHRMIHRKKNDILTVEELREIITTQRLKK